MVQRQHSRSDPEDESPYRSCRERAPARTRVTTRAIMRCSWPSKSTGVLLMFRAKLEGTVPSPRTTASVLPFGNERPPGGSLIARNLKLSGCLPQ